MSESKTVDATLGERGSIYGDYDEGIKARSAIMGILERRHEVENGIQMPPVFREALSDIVHKLVRLSVCPTHVDSAHDIQGYAALYEVMISAKSKSELE